MNFFRFPKSVLVAGALGIVFLPQTSSALFGINLFNKKKDARAVASPEIAQAQEASGSSSLNIAAQLEQEGKTGAAINLCKKIVKESPLTEAAALAQYNLGALYEKEGNSKKAFEAYQAFIENYKSSSRFNDALTSQYRIAESLKSNGGKKKVLKVIPLPSGSDDVIEMFVKIRANAPFGRLAAPSQFAVAEIYQNQGKLVESATAYQSVVDNYSGTSLAKEAQYRIGAINNSVVTKSQDASNIQKSRDATQAYIATNPAGERVGDARQILTGLDDAEALKVYRIAQYYDRQGNSRAAAIYYNDVLAFSSTKLADDAQRRLAVLTRNNPKLLAQTPLNQTLSDSAVAAKTKLKTRDDYFGPLSPALAENTKPKMLIEKRDVRPVTKQPALPKGKATDPSLLILPPEDSGAPMILPPVEDTGKAKTTVKPETKKPEGSDTPASIESAPLGNDAGSLVIPPTETPASKPDEVKPMEETPTTTPEEKPADAKPEEPAAKPEEKKAEPSADDAPLLSPTPVPVPN